VQIELHLALVSAMGFCGIMKTEVLPRLDMTLQNPIASRFHLLSLRE
jgi:hypothetical protein